jgi:single-stranded-DNA-specific exonuclease
MAAGLTIQPGNLEQFRAHLNDLARQQIPTALLRPNLRLDAEVPLQELTLRNLAELARLQPVGQGNPAVQLCARNLEHARPAQRMGSGKQHVKMWVGENSEVREAVWWGVGDAAIPEGRFDLAFIPQENHYNGRSAVQLKVLDWRPAGE